MTEIEKMFENAGINKRCCANIKFDDCIYSPSDCGYYNYPDFTAEKQLELIKWLAYKFSFFAIEYNFQEWSISNGLISGYYEKSLEESISGYINSLWQDLTDQEKEEIRGILNENTNTL